MTWTIAKRFEFSYSHILNGLAEGHQCGRMHGHNGIIEVVLSGDTLTEVGFIMDYGDMKPLKQMIDDTLDHRHLNDIALFNPTAENWSRRIFEWCVEQGWPVSAVGWSETPKTWAWYTPSGPPPRTDTAVIEP